MVMNTKSLKEMINPMTRLVKIKKLINDDRGYIV